MTARRSTGARSKRAAAYATAVLVVHGGAGTVASEQRRRASLASVRSALAAGSAVLAQSAEAAVVAAVSVMESGGVLNAGRGATQDEQGRMTLDAGFMEGRRRRFGAVGCVTRTYNPILLAQRLANRAPFGCFLVGADADALCARLGLAFAPPNGCGPNSKQTRRTRPADTADTVGAVALDARGRLAAAVSTGGLRDKPAGRVGDSAVVGAGFWAEDGLGACVTTGVGEAMLREGTARRCVRLLADGLAPEAAARTALAELHDRFSSPHAGLIVVTADGRIAIDHTSDFMPAGYAHDGERPSLRSDWRRRAPAKRVRR